jgi:hypothetical protein
MKRNKKIFKKNALFVDKRWIDLKSSQEDLKFIFRKLTIFGIIYFTLHIFKERANQSLQALRVTFMKKYKIKIYHGFQ